MLGTQFTDAEIPTSSQSMIAPTRKISCSKIDHLADNEYVQQYGVNGQDSDGVTPLFLACIEGKEQLAKALLEAKAKVNTKNNDGCSALLAAALEGHEGIVGLLIETKADIELTDNNGYTALHWAALGGKAPTVKQLLSAGAQVNAQDNDGRTALYVAAGGGFEPLVKTLLEAKAETLLRDNNGRTPMSMAAQRRHESIVRLIAQAKTDEGRRFSLTPASPSISISITRFDFRQPLQCLPEQGDSDVESPAPKRHSLSLPSPRKSPKFDTLAGFVEEC
jgi:ankyrin repeat protein